MSLGIFLTSLWLSFLILKNRIMIWIKQLCLAKCLVTNKFLFICFILTMTSNIWSSFKFPIVLGWRHKPLLLISYVYQILIQTYLPIIILYAFLIFLSSFIVVTITDVPHITSLCPTALILNLKGCTKKLRVNKQFFPCNIFLPVCLCEYSI